MRHIYASGEHMYSQNVKELTEGKFVSEYIDYNEVEEKTIYETGGNIEGKAVIIKFSVKPDAFDRISFRNSVKILMQSDILQADWESYEISYL